MEVTGEEVHCQNRFSRTGCDQQTTQANGQLCVPLTAAAAAVQHAKCANYQSKSIRRHYSWWPISVSANKTNWAVSGLCRRALRVLSKLGRKTCRHGHGTFARQYTRAKTNNELQPIFSHFLYLIQRSAQLASLAGGRKFVRVYCRQIAYVDVWLIKEKNNT